MGKRVVKQLIYGIIFLGIFGLIIFAGYAAVRPAPTCFDNKQNGNETGVDCGGGCIPCGAKNAQALQNSSVNILSSGDNKVVLITKITNPNENFGASDFIYNFNIYGNNGEVIKTVSDHSFIYASDNKYLIDFADIDAKNISRADINFSDFNWQDKDIFKKLDINIKNWELKVFDPSKNPLPPQDFQRDLSVGIKGDDVKVLEQYLNDHGYFKGIPDNVFDLATKKAVSDFQKAKKISPATGYFGGTERDIINKEFDDLRKNIPQLGEIYPVTIEGTVKNNDIISPSKIIITGFVYDNSNVLLGASKYELESLDPTSEKDFRIIFPKNIDVKNVNQNATKVFVDSLR